MLRSKRPSDGCMSRYHARGLSSAECCIFLFRRLSGKALSQNGTMRRRRLRHTPAYIGTRIYPELTVASMAFSKKTALFVSVARDGDAQCLSCFESRLKLARAVPCREWLADTISLSRLHCMCAHCKGQGWTSCWELSTVDSLTVVHVPSVIVLALKPIAWARGPIPRFRKPTHRAIPTTTRAITADRWPRGVSNWFPQTAS